MRKSCIVIDRQYGSGGRAVGMLLSKRFQIPFYDGELLMITAEKAGLNPGVLREFDERRTGSLLYDIAMFAGGFENNNKITEPFEVFEAVSDTIRKLAMEGPCIFMGRCADAVLKDVCGYLNVFIYASSMKERIKRAYESDHITTKNIESYIRRKDNQRKNYYKIFAEKEWGRMENYDLCLNTSAFGYAGCADIIAAMAENKDKIRKKE